MRRLGAAAVAATVALSGCAQSVEDRAAKVCEASVLRDVADPAAFRRTTVTSEVSDPLTPARFEALVGYPPPRKTGDAEADALDETVRQVRATELAAAGDDLRLMRVNVSYALGDRQETATCAFRLIRGKLDSEERLARAAEPDTGDEARATLARLKGEAAQPPRRGRFRCCLSSY